MDHVVASPSPPAHGHSADKAPLSAPCPGEATTLVCVDGHPSQLGAACVERLTPVDVVGAVTDLADGYRQAGRLTVAASVYDQAINLGRTCECVPGVQRAAAAAIAMAFTEMGGDAPALDYARQISLELMLTIDGTRDDGVRLLGEVVTRALDQREPSILRRCLVAVQTACARERTAGHDVPSALAALDRRLAAAVGLFRMPVSTV